MDWGGTGLRPVVSGVAPETGMGHSTGLQLSGHVYPTSSDDIRRDAEFDGRDARSTRVYSCPAARSFETDFADAILKVAGAADDFDFDAHEIDRQVAPGNLPEAHGVLLRGDDDLALAFLAAVDGFEDSLLLERVMAHETLGIAESPPSFTRLCSKLSG